VLWYYNQRRLPKSLCKGRNFLFAINRMGAAINLPALVPELLEVLQEPREQSLFAEVIIGVSIVGPMSS
jgi:hypothetical protein